MAEPRAQLRPKTALAASLMLSFAAGYVDSCTFLALFGLFVAQVTGSFVAAAAQLVSGQHGLVLTTFAIPIFLIAGAVTTLIVALAEDRRIAPLPWCLGLECALLAAFLAAGARGLPFRVPGAPLAVIAGVCGLSAMGVQSALVQLLMRGTPSTNVMTTNTTQLAIAATQAALGWYARRRATNVDGARRFASASDRLTSVLSVALGFLLGTITGALAYSVADLWCLIVPIAVIAGILAWSLRVPTLADAN